MATRAVTFLKKHKIPFELVKYEHQEKGAKFAARATGYSPGHTVKTLVVEFNRGQYALVLMAGDREVAMKQLARAGNAKRAALVDNATAERLTGYLVGGISPFGTRQRLPVFMEEGLLGCGTVLINAGQRGSMLKMTPADIKSALDCQMVSVSQS